MNGLILHMGPEYPKYINDCITQFFLFNKEAKLFFIVENNFSELDELVKNYENLIIIKANTIKKSFQHRFFLMFNQNSYRTWRNGFWRYVMQRFFLIADFIENSKEKNIIHFEYDNLIYQNINQLDTYFKNVNKLSILLESDKKCVPGVVYIPQGKDLKDFCKFYNKVFTLQPFRNWKRSNDMVAFAKYREIYPEKCNVLPVIPPLYAQEHELKALDGFITSYPKLYYQEYEKTKTLFDAAALGQFIGGVDPKNIAENAESEGYIGTSPVYNPSKLPIKWITNKEGLKCPFIEYPKETFIPLFNLHIHAKTLSKFRSDLI